MVHNFPPSDPKQPFGVDGFRYWTERDEYAPPFQVLCDCPWEPHPHYTAQMAKTV